MTTIVAVRKNGRAVIGADTLVTYGDQLESAELIANHSKLIQVGDTWLAVTGHAAMDLVLRGLFSPPPGKDRCRRSFEGVEDIFRTFLDVHRRMKDRYYLRTEDDKEEEFESMHMNLLLANRHGIFGVCSRRSVFEYCKYYAFGSGEQYAMGALQVLYERLDDAEAIARGALEAAAALDCGTGLPLELRGMDLD